jgi:glycosyltransferase involved in cell wall biosynthesis
MLSDLYPPLLGGIERHAQALSRGLSQRGHEIIICTTRQHDLAKYEEEEGIKIHRLSSFFQMVPFLYKDPRRKWHPPTRDWQITSKLAQIMEQEKPNIIHAHGWILYSALPLKQKLRIPLVVTLHCYDLFCPKKIWMRGNVICDKPLTIDCITCLRKPYGLVRALLAYYGVKINRNQLKYVDKFIAVSSFAKETHVKHLGISDDWIVTIPNFCDSGTERTNERAEGLPNEFILFVGWLMPHKGLDLLIKAYQRLNTETKLLIIGIQQPDYHYQSTDDVLVIENAPHEVVMQAMSKCKFTVFPSISPDTCPTVALEAMSQKKAVIASSVGGLKDIVVDGKTGVLIPPNNLDRLAEAIYQLLQSPEVASEMGERGYERFVKNYTPNAVIPRIIDVYESLI